MKVEIREKFKFIELIDLDIAIKAYSCMSASKKYYHYYFMKIKEKESYFDDYNSLWFILKKNLRNENNS